MLTGTTLRTATLTSALGGQHTIDVVEPDQSQANRRELLAAEQVWARQTRTLLDGGHMDAARRAKFASDVLFLAAQSLLVEHPADAHVLVAQENDGTVRGAIFFALDDVWELDLLTTDPPNQGGNPNPDRIKGIGGALLGSAADMMVQRACSTVELEPLDDAARSFWTAQGFRDFGRPPYLRVGCPELQAIACRLEAEGDDHAYCHDAAMLSRVSLTA